MSATAEGATGRRPGGTRFGLSATLSFMMHGSVVVALLLGSRGPRASAAPVYRVELLAAPAGPRALGVVSEQPSPPPSVPDEPLPKRAVSETKKAVTTPAKKAPPKARTTSKATPTPDATPSRFDRAASKAGGGPVGGKGADVAGVKTEGVDFPYPAYLENIVRQVALRWKPRPGPPTSAEIAFMIRRDGTVVGITYRTRSSSFIFDSDAKGAIEAAAAARAFGPLPSGYSDDVLAVIFFFDPTVIR